MNDNDITAHCAYCYKDKSCKIEGGNALSDCPTKNRDARRQELLKNYATEGYYDFLLQSLRQVAAGYEVDENRKPHPVKTRLQELIEFCHRMGYKRLGLAFCTALEDDAKKLTQILNAEGFEVVSIVCKVGGIEKPDIGLEEEGKIVPGRREISCNPLEQAYICNEAKTEFNIVFGLCLGHDSIFLKASDAMCTVFVVKDRVLGHYPLKAIKEHQFD